MTILPPLKGDPRLAEGLRLLEAGDWLEASDVFEELYFEAVRDEVPLVRVLLQLATGLHHRSMGQRRPARERLEEAARAMGEVTNGHGVDLEWLRERISAALA
ncbi:MAG TPA: DUF309 domain-containing protein [Thermoanaerobaculia bacterium]|jgi:predicted metal-dependent hydrolase